MRLMGSTLLRTRRIAIAGALLALAGVSAAQTSGETYVPKVNSHIFNFTAPYTPHTIPQPNFSNSPRIEQLIHDGNIYLSLDDAVALALENNLDLAIARYNLSIADTDIIRSQAGQALRGVASGVVQGTPGGGVNNIGTGGTVGATGAGAGGTTAASGGAAAGTGGLVQSTLGGGPATPSFDPFLSGNLQMEHAATPQASAFSGVPLLTQNTGLGNFTYNQGFASGTNLSVGFNNSRATTNSPFTSLSPFINSSFRATVTQHLLQGFGWNLNRRNIVIAKNDREITDIAFRQQVISTVVQIQNIYWDLVAAYEDVKVKKESVALAEKTLADNKRQVEIGTLAPIEVVRAESDLASRNQDLIISQTTLQLQQLLMKNAVSRNLTDPQLAAAPIIPTDTMEVAQVEPVVPTEDLINDALSHRPELAQSRIDLTNRQITNKALRNGLLPTVDIYGFYGASSLGGEQNPAGTCGSPTLPPDLQSFCTPAGTFPTQSYGGAFGNLFNSSAPDKGAGISIQIPIRNRAAQADQIRGQLEYQQAQMRLLQQQNQIRIDVRNSQFALMQDRGRVEAARKAVDLARESLDAEQKKYALGASTNTLVLQAQRDLTQAESTLLTTKAAYQKQKVDLDRATGLLLTHLGIEFADAETGHVQQLPHVPGVVPASQVAPSARPSSSVQPNSQLTAPPAAGTTSTPQM